MARRIGSSVERGAWSVEHPGIQTPRPSNKAAALYALAFHASPSTALRLLARELHVANQDIWPAEVGTGAGVADDEGVGAEAEGALGEGKAHLVPGEVAAADGEVGEGAWAGVDRRAVEDDLDGIVDIPLIVEPGEDEGEQPAGERSDIEVEGAGVVAATDAVEGDLGLVATAHVERLVGPLQQIGAEVLQADADRAATVDDARRRDRGG